MARAEPSDAQPASRLVCPIPIALCRQGADLGFWPILVRDACGFGNEEAANHSVASLRHMGDTTISDADTVCGMLEKFASVS